MTKKGLRFQTKLILAMVFAILVVTIAILSVTEEKVRRVYTHHFEARFSTLASGIEESRENRSQGFMEVSTKLAKHPYVINFLKQKTTPGTEGKVEFFEAYRAALQSEEGKTTGPERLAAKGKNGILNRFAQQGNNKPLQERLSQLGIIGAIDLDGNKYTLSSGSQKVRTRNRPKGPTMASEIEGLNKVLAIENQEVGHFVIESKNGQTQVQEMIITPVFDPETGQKLGLFVRGATAETSAERLLDRYDDQFDSESKMESGIFLDAEFHSRSIDANLSHAITEAIGDVFANRAADTASKDQHGHENSRVEIAVAGKPYLLFYTALNAESFLPPAWQVVLFPLSELKKDLRELRVIGSGTGVLALLLGLIIALFLSKNLTVPIKALNEGTQHIRDGDFKKRVRIYSGDEVGELASSFNSMAEELEQKAHYRKLLEKVSDEAVAQAMISGSLDLELGGELKTVSVLFCDIRGFTALTEHMHPSEVIDMLNDHMTTMTRVVRENLGVVDKFVGDEIMAVFGALRSEGNDAANAARCAVEMIEARQKRNAELEYPIHIGIGVATGEVVAGCMGSVDRLNYTVLGARVNLAARLCGQAGKMESIIDDKTYEQMGHQADADPLSGIELKGFTGVISAYRLNSLKNGASLNLRG